MAVRDSVTDRRTHLERLNDRLADAWLDDLRARRLAANTIRGYHRDLAALVRFADAQGSSVDRLDRRDLETFVRQRMASGLAPRSVARAVASIRGFYRFLRLDGHVEVDPAEDLHPPHSWPALPKFLSTAAVDALLKQPDTETPVGVRDRTLIELLYATGLRVSSSCRCGRPTSTCERAVSPAWGRGTRRGSSRLGAPPSSGCGGTRRRPARRCSMGASRRGCSSTRAGACGSAASASGRSSSSTPSRPACRATWAARAASLVRDAPARAGRRPADHPGPAGSRRPLDDQIYTYVLDTRLKAIYDEFHPRS